MESEHDTIEVAGCGECPHRMRTLYGAELCQRTEPLRGIELFLHGKAPPSWCPLRTRPVLVRLRTEAR